MLPKKLRFSLRQDTDYFLKSNRVFTSGFTVFYLPSDQFAAAIIVSKKTAALATERSHMKRVFSEALTEVAQELNEKLPKLQCVFSLKNSVMRMTSEQITQLIQKTITQLGQNATSGIR